MTWNAVGTRRMVSGASTSRPASVVIGLEHRRKVLFHADDGPSLLACLCERFLCGVVVGELPIGVVMMNEHRKLRRLQHRGVTVGVPAREYRLVAGARPDVDRLARPVIDGLLDTARPI